MYRRTTEKEVFCLSWTESTVMEQRKEFIQIYETVGNFYTSDNGEKAGKCKKAGPPA